jgi:hypothetical protein
MPKGAWWLKPFGPYLGWTPSRPPWRSRRVALDLHHLVQAGHHSPRPLSQVAFLRAVRANMGRATSWAASENMTTAWIDRP